MQFVEQLSNYPPNQTRWCELKYQAGPVDLVSDQMDIEKSWGINSRSFSHKHCSSGSCFSSGKDGGENKVGNYGQPRRFDDCDAHALVWYAIAERDPTVQARTICPQLHGERDIIVGLWCITHHYKDECTFESWVGQKTEKHHGSQRCGISNVVRWVITVFLTIRHMHVWHIPGEPWRPEL